VFTISLGQAITFAVAALGSQAIFLRFAGWLIQSLVSHRLTKEAEEFKIKLQSGANVEIEKLRASLQQTATEHQIRFAKLHEQRAEVVKDLYQRLVHARSDAALYILGDARNKDLAAETNEKMLELYRFISLSRIYLPEKLCESLDSFESTLRRSVINVDVFWARVNQYTLLSPENQAMQNKVMLEACNFLESKSPAMLTELVREFRVLLGEQPQAAS
jgi:hypothetical protein